MKTEVRLSVTGGKETVAGIVNCPLKNLGCRKSSNSEEYYKPETSFCFVREHMQIFVDSDETLMIELLETDVHSEESGSNYKT